MQVRAFLFPMPTSLTPEGVSNIALSKIGAQPINSLLDTTNPSAVFCNQNFGLASIEVARSSRWNCILQTAVLTQIVQTPLPGCTPPVSAPTWEPLTSYLADTYFTYGGYFYFVLINYTSTNNFTNDLTNGTYFVQTNLPTDQPFFPNNGSQYPSGWAYGYALPGDCQLVCAVNENTYWGWEYYGDQSNDYEIIGPNIYCDEPQAVIQYVQNVTDTTRWDSMFTNCVALKLASMVATPLRQDGGQLERALIGEYRTAMKEARQKNGGEKKERRFNPIGSSLFNRSRYGGQNG